MATDLGVLSQCFDLAGYGIYPFIEAVPVLSQILEDANHPGRQDTRPLRKNVGQCMAQPMDALAHGNAVLQEKAADLIDCRGSLPNQPVAHAMQRLKIELFVCLCRHTPRRWTLHRFCDRKCIAEVILVRLPEGLGIDRWDLPNVMADGES
jgi:hypothetical protein